VAITFAAASSQYLENTADTPISAVGFTMSGWFYIATGAESGFFSLNDQSSAVNRSFIDILGGSDTARFLFEGSSTNGSTSANSATAGAWNHVCGRSVSLSSGIVTLNGDHANQGTNGTNIGAYPSQDSVSVSAARDTTPSYFSGSDAECAIWNVSLTDAEVTMLALGISPLLVRPGNLVRYYPLNEGVSPSRELITGANLTWFNTPTATAHHPAMRYPRRRHIITVPAAVGAANPHNPLGHPLYGPFAGPVS
jgi:hypothetical protein